MPIRQRSSDPSRPGKTVSIPIRILPDGRFEYFYGGALPELSQGAVAKLVVEAIHVQDKRMLAVLTAEHVEPMLSRSYGLLLLMRPPEGLSALRRRHLRQEPIGEGGRTESGIAVYALDDQNVRLRGSKPATLEPARWMIPALRRTASSLNEAYRLVSEVFEPHRRSHSGNVFHLAFQKESGTWRPLADLREAVQARHEGQLHACSR